ncbi:MAG TPA: lipocalin family protein [Chitinophagaceae bacterium]|jgi:hypothetical protein|nr:lipocalin family protein [Chitinophagaceae bacterium]
MKKFIASLMLMFLISSSYAQTAKELIGKWKLSSWTMNGKPMDIESVFKTKEVFQVFKEGNQFESIVGSKVTKGTWDLSNDNKKLSIHEAGENAVFTINTFDEKNRSITSPDVGTMIYVKQGTPD